ncbi:thiol reductant ABC exporter subunit CydC [Rhodococcus sp. H29-C3]|uniref:thiol reductant ABC exporter subunit CydC n=1 Tax=Rhodococcus sp. H29-C3 TaxID=3046307 RepID=UPI0024B8D185|nr:thiol reductant ABC exporter subunit CydC [Rhodococcus sp. H29-C3]MDJ0360216.1 thiol reductant ABC exporter subunit CydC [Rhodococcus sp. H29-C3]
MLVDLRRALELLELRPSRVAMSVAAGVATLGSALTLAAVSAWLITRAWQMPPVLDLTVAVVAVRALGISRGVFRYLERLATHDTALRGTTSARTRLYERLAAGNPAAAAGLRRGDLMSRTGNDVDVLGDVVVRAIVPICVSIVLAIAAVVVLAFVSPAAALILLLALVVAGVLAPYWAARSAVIAESEGISARSEFSETAVRALDHAGELRVAGRLDETLRDAAEANRESVKARDRAALPAAFADAALPLSIGAAVLGSLLVGISLYGSTGGTAGGMTPMALAIIVLVPLSAFEATSALPGAAIALTRARISASRIVELLDAADEAAPQTVNDLDSLTDRVTARNLRCGWPGSSSTTVPVDLDVGPGARVAIVGPSGIGKSTLLMTLAGLLPPISGTVEGSGARFFAEDAHLFDTSILENLRVARGDVQSDEAVETLDRVGLGAWISSLPDGIDTPLVGGAQAVSGGQRRRILLARALLSDAPILLLDEPTEHLDDDGGAQLLRRLLDRSDSIVDGNRAVVVVTHQLPADNHADLVLDLGVADRNIPLPTSESRRTLLSTRERRWSDVEEL